MVRLTVLIATCVLGAPPAEASPAVSLGYSEETAILGTGIEECASGILTYHHDGSFENGYAWQYSGQQPPYYGALGEAYDLTEGLVVCGAYWLSQLMDFWVDPPADCYIWQGGTGSAPGAVLALVAGVDFGPTAIWPAISRHDIEMGVAVDGPFTIGYWGRWPGNGSGWYCAADVNGAVGHPWTCIAPGIGYPSGWQDPSVVWGPTASMGCGVYFQEGTPVESETWGSIKAVFR